MSLSTSRRDFLKTAATTGASFGMGDLSFLSKLPGVSRAESMLKDKYVRFHPDNEPLVRLLEDTPRERLLEEVAARIKRGLSYRELLAALLLAGVRNIQPRPVGFKFHAVLVVNSAHLASIASPDLTSAIAVSGNGRSWEIVADPDTLGRGVINGLTWDPVRQQAIGVGWDGQTPAAVIWVGR